MTTDRTTKALLFAIAVGLWLHLAADFARPTPAHAQDLFSELAVKQMATHLSNISSDTAQMAASLRSIQLNMGLQPSAPSGRRQP